MLPGLVGPLGERCIQALVRAYFGRGDAAALRRASDAELLALHSVGAGMVALIRQHWAADPLVRAEHGRDDWREHAEMLALASR